MLYYIAHTLVLIFMSYISSSTSLNMFFGFQEASSHFSFGIELFVVVFFNLFLDSSRPYY